MLLRRPRDKWLEHHAFWMTWSYVGLGAAAASEATTRLPETPFWWMVAGATFLVVGIGARMIKTNVPRIIDQIRGGPPAAPPPVTTDPQHRAAG